MHFDNESCRPQSISLYNRATVLASAASHAEIMAHCRLDVTSKGWCTFCRPRAKTYENNYFRYVNKILKALKNFIIGFFFFNRHCNPCGLWPAKLSLSILSRKVLQSAVASGTSNPQLGGPVIRTFQLPPPGIPHVWNDASEPQQRKVELWARNWREFCRKWRLPRHFWVLLHAVNLRHRTDGFTSPPKEDALRIFSSFHTVRNISELYEP